MSSIYHEARKREKATQKLFTEHKKWAEKRREENRVDPATLLQVNGLKAEIIVDSNVYKQAAKSLVAWQGDSNITIDRFDVRGTLTSIPGEVSKKKGSGSRSQPALDSDQTEPFKKLLNYERYRLLIQNEINEIPEETRLKLVAHTVALSSEAKIKKLRNNKFGTSGEANPSLLNPTQLHSTLESKRPSAAIPFKYDNSDNRSPINELTETTAEVDDIDDIAADLDTIEVPPGEDSKKIAEISRNYGLSINQFSTLAKDDGVARLRTEEILRIIGSDMVIKQQPALVEPVEPNDEIYGPELPPGLQAVSSRVSTSSSSSISEPSDDRSIEKISTLDSQNPSDILLPSTVVQETKRSQTKTPCQAIELAVDLKTEPKSSPGRRRAPTPLVYRLSPYVERDRHFSRRKNRSSKDYRRSSSRSSDSLRQRYPSLSSHTSSDSDPPPTARRRSSRKRRSKNRNRSRSRSISRQRDRNRDRHRPHTSKSRTQSSRARFRRD